MLSGERHVIIGAKRTTDRAEAGEKEMCMEQQTALSPKGDMKHYHYRQIYDAIYREGQLTKKQLAQKLRLSMPTVAQNLTQLQSDGLVAYLGHEASTGGRKPEVIGPVRTARIAAGLEVIHEMARLIVVDLCGTVLLEQCLCLPYSREERYFDRLCQWANGLLHSLEPMPILGIGIAIQGLLLPDRSAVSFGRLLSDGIRLEAFSGRLDWPCRLIHDVEAAAVAELWYQPDLTDSIYLSLNRNTGGALIIHGGVYSGRCYSSGTVEHMCIHPGGRRCYCGKQGCLEAYCSAAALEQASSEPIERFFSGLYRGQPAEIALWQDYLQDLALAIDNARMVVRGDILLGGLIHEYMRQEDLALLHRCVMEQTFFRAEDLTIRRGRCGEKAAALGGALSYIRQFLDSI